MSDFALKEKILKEFKNLGVAPDFKMSQSFYFECLGKLVSIQNLSFLLHWYRINKIKGRTSLRQHGRRRAI